MALRSDQVTAGDVVRRQHHVVRWRTRLHPEWMTCRPPGGLKAWAGAGAAAGHGRSGPAQFKCFSNFPNFLDLTNVKTILPDLQNLPTFARW
jgi:hypothetical protein